MSATLTTLAIGVGIEALAAATIGDVFIQPFRAIGLIIPDVIIEETHRDELDITSHPVQRSPTITDNSIKKPMEVSMRVGWSNSGHYAGIIGAAANVRDVYNSLLTLQATRIPFSVYTGKRYYPNMLIASLVETTSAQYGDFTLMAQVLLRELIIVDTQSATTLSSSSIPSKTGDFSGLRSQQPQSIPMATSNSISEQSASFNGVSSLPVNPSSTSQAPFLIGGA